MRLSELAAKVGVSQKTLRNYLDWGWLRADKQRGRYGEEYIFTADHVAEVQRIQAEVKGGKRQRNRDHRSAVIATEHATVRRTGGKDKVIVTRLLAKGERPAVVLATMARNGISLRRLDWPMLIEVYKQSYGTANPVELAEMGAPLPQTVDRLRRRVLARLRQEYAQTVRRSL